MQQIKKIKIKIKILRLNVSKKYVGSTRCNQSNYSQQILMMSGIKEKQNIKKAVDPRYASDSKVTTDENYDMADHKRALNVL